MISFLRIVIAVVTVFWIFSPLASECSNASINSLEQEFRFIVKNTEVKSLNRNGKSVEVNPVRAELQHFFDLCLRKKLASVKVEELDVKARKSLLNLLYEVNFYIPHSLTIQQQLQVVEALDLQPHQLRSRYGEILSAYTRLRDFAQYNALARRLGLPTKRVLPGSHLRVDGVPVLELINSDTLINRRVVLPAGPYLVVVFSPVCGFSKAFFNWLLLKENHRFSAKLSERLLFLLPAEGAFFEDEIQALQRQFPHLKFRYAVKPKDWLQIGVWATPSLYFYQSGRVVEQIVGWPKDNVHSARFAEAVKRLGF